MCAQMQQRGRWAFFVVGASCVQAAAVVNSDEYLNTTWPCLGVTFPSPPVWLLVNHTRNGAPVYVTEGTPNDGSYHYLYQDPDCDGHDGNSGFGAWIISSTPPDTCADKDLDGDLVCQGHAYLGTGATEIPMDAMWRVYCCDHLTAGCTPQLYFMRFHAVPASTPGLPNIDDFPALSLPHTCPTFTESTSISSTTSATTLTDTMTTITSRTTITVTLTDTTTDFTGSTVVTSITETTTSFFLDVKTRTTTTLADLEATNILAITTDGVEASTGAIVGILVALLLVAMCCCGCVYLRQMQKGSAASSGDPQSAAAESGMQQDSSI